MAERLFGVETEYAIAGMNGRGTVDRSAIVQQLMDLAHQLLVHLPDLCSGGMFLQNGARLYIDCGLHPEMTTPECANPWDIARYIQAGERMLGELSRSVESRHPQGAEIMCFRCNVDYGGTHATWGCHESYLHRMQPDALPPQIIPHLVSRVIYTGAGGFNPLSPGLEFTLSPRAAHIEHVVSKESTARRGIFHTKNESLCRGGYSRLHILCGESLCSEIATFLKVGATALVVAMAEAGLSPGVGVELASPLEALHCVSGDVTCRRPLQMANGRSLTAIEIQRHYLAMAEAHAGEEFMPPWSAEVCRRWRTMLDQLEGAPRSVAGVLDWAIKLPLYADYAGRHGVAWDLLPFWNEVLGRLNTALEGTPQQGQPVSVDVLIGPESPIPNEIGPLTSFLRSRGQQWDGLRQYVDLRQALYEVDTRFGQLGGKGIFQSLDAAGVLDHRVSGVDNIEHAMANPPAVGRARIRGQVVRRLAGNNGSWHCDWQTITDEEGHMLDLSDPFAAEESWHGPLAEEPQPAAPPPPSAEAGPATSAFQRYLAMLRGRV